MPTVTKITIDDNRKLREELDSLYEQATQKQVARWSLELATHMLHEYAPQYLENQIICNGFSTHKKWQKDEVKVHNVRQAGFQIHRLAKGCKDTTTQIALRIAGHAVATGHMKEHGMVASDYAIKLIHTGSNLEKCNVTHERIWQINTLKNICME